MTTTAEAFDWQRFDGVLFDLDGVITPTADIHEQAWLELFSQYDATTDDYLRYIDGKPRAHGVRSFLESRGIDLPEGQPDDPPGDRTIWAMGNRKNLLFLDILQRDGVAPYPGSAALVDHLDAIGVPAGIVSSSKNAKLVLDRAGMTERFPVVVDGIVAADEHLNGKPAPDAFLLGAERLGTRPDHTVVVEDAESGVAAGRAGDFAIVIGVDRGAGHDALRRHGADIVVDDLAELVPSEPGR